MQYKQCSKCEKWDYMSKEQTLCSDCKKNKSHETFELTGVTPEQIKENERITALRWMLGLSGVLLSAVSYLVYFLPQQKIWWLIGCFCAIDLVHLFITCFNIFGKEKHRIIKSIGGVIAYVLALFIIFVIIAIFGAGVTDGLQLAFDLKVDAVFCIIFSAPVAVIVCCLLALILEGM